MNISFKGSGEPISTNAMRAASGRLDCESESLWALLAVETRGFGYLPDGRPKILFERHVFHRLTGGRFDQWPDLSNAIPRGYLGGAAEYERLARAAALDADAALQSASWGLGQIMGFNAGKLHYPDARAMVDAFVGAEDAQLDGVCRFIEGTAPLRTALRERDWDTVALHYNGTGYREFGYHTKLNTAYTGYHDHGCPDVDVRAAQAYLDYLGFDPHGIDGIVGRYTRDALHHFQRQAGLDVDDAIDGNTVAALRAAFAKKRH